MTAPAALRAFTVEGPVQAEIMVLALADGQVILSGPCGAAPWYVEIEQGADPMAAVTAITQVNVGDPAVVHSTSWRQARGGVVLTFVAVLDAAVLGDQERVTVQRSDLARGAAAAAPGHIPQASVIEHGLRHLAWLAKDDPVVAGALPPGWLAELEHYVPEPFRHLA